MKVGQFLQNEGCGPDKEGLLELGEGRSGQIHVETTLEDTLASQDRSRKQIWCMSERSRTLQPDHTALLQEGASNGLDHQLWST